MHGDVEDFEEVGLGGDCGFQLFHVGGGRGAAVGEGEDLDFRGEDCGGGGGLGELDQGYG